MKSRLFLLFKSPPFYSLEELFIGQEKETFLVPKLKEEETWLHEFSWLDAFSGFEIDMHPYITVREIMGE